jgi:hypothetical protein
MWRQLVGSAGDLALANARLYGKRVISQRQSVTLHVDLDQ